MKRFITASFLILSVVASAGMFTRAYPMGNVWTGHYYHGYPAGWRASYGIPYAYWNGVAYAYGYGGYYFSGNRYGSIAYSTSTGAYGWSKGWNDPMSARHQALSNCASLDCQEVSWFANSCGSLAVSATTPAAYGWSWNVYAANAESNAVFECSRRAYDCVTVVSVCN